ncbi:MAG TPA: class I adenylate-forming enzyme family protein [Coleofasciculaceae cyanobacterium]|jgi:acyl-CoA synthetase (AMP-forming)/AMP-acid ligase II
MPGCKPIIFSQRQNTGQKPTDAPARQIETFPEKAPRPAFQLHHFAPVTRLRFGQSGYHYSPEQSIVNRLRERARRYPNQVAVRIPDAFAIPGKKSQLTHWELYLEARKMANILKNHYHIRPGDTVATMETNTLDFYKLLYATEALGARLMPLNIAALEGKHGKQAHEKLAYMLAASHSKVMFQGDVIYQNPRFNALKGIKRLERFLGPRSKRFVTQKTCTTRRLLNQIPSFNKAFYLVENLPENLPIVTPRQRDQLLAITKPLPENELMLKPSGDTEALLMFSSGTTQANPKATPITHAALAYNVQQVAKVMASDVSAADTQVAGLPMYHIYGLLAVLAATERNARIMLVPDLTEAVKHPEKLLDAIAQEKATFMPLVPKVLNRILEEIKENPESRKKLDTLRFMISGGVYLPKEMHERFNDLLPGKALWEGYGMTEIGIVTVNRTGEWGHVGRPPEGGDAAKIEVRNPDGEGYGEVWVQTPGRAKPYEGGAPEGPDSPFKPDNWFNTGDIGRFVGECNLQLMGRADDIINIHGEKYTSEDFKFLLHHLPIRHQLTFQLPPDKGSKIVSVVLSNTRDENTEKNFKVKLGEAAKNKKDFNPQLIPDYILPLTGHDFPADLISNIGKIRGRAYINSLVQEGVISLEKDGLKIHHPERI